MPDIPTTFSLPALSPAEIDSLSDAGTTILECYRVLRKGGLNIVGEVLKDQGTFYELEHYPKDDVFDQDSHSQYYYHAHRSGLQEHGHFHTFLRQPGMHKHIKPVANQGGTRWPVDDQALTHIVGITMDAYGFPISMFTTNRWVTGEAWYRAEDIIAMLDLFRIDHAFPSWPVNIWLTNMLMLFRPQIEWLIKTRDQVIGQWQFDHPETDVYEDRKLEITGEITINVESQIRNIMALLDECS